MADLGILIDYEWCTGCHTCETACQMEHGFGVNEFGIKMQEIGPWPYGDDQWVMINIPVPTAQCDFCAERAALGKKPTCMHHCQGQCLKVGPIEELTKELCGKKQQVLFHN